MELNKLSGAELGRAFAARQLDPREVLQDCLARTVRLNTSEPMFVRLLTDRAEVEAAASSERYRAGTPLGPLDGVPIAWKDLFDVAGTITSSGSVVRGDIAVEDAEAIKKMTAVGAVAVGKTNMSEFAFSTLGLNPHFGTPANAFDTNVRRVPGGSSSGAAVAVANGCVPIAMGSDTGGSIRIPASLNGLVGFKPSHGRYDMRGVFPLAQSLDTIGPLARSVEDCLLIDLALRGVTSVPAREAASLKGARFVISIPGSLENAEPDVVKNFERSMERLGRAGAKIDRREMRALREIDEVQKRYGSLILIEAYENLATYAQGPDAEKMDRRVRERVLTGKGRSAEDLAALREGQDRLAAALKEDLNGAMLIAPTVIIAPPAIDALEADEAYLHANMAMRQNTAPANFLKLPSISLPNGLDGTSLPTGLMISAPVGEDDRLLSLAAAVEHLAMSS
jgi:aspartyl-tRNA(Asn)/glutamyl-tRNA(Gln) amidotransferase subunit A